MKTKTLAAIAALCAAVMAVSACKPIEGDGDRNRPATAFADLKDEKQKVSYIIGTQMGEQLAPVKDEVDMAVLVRALRDAVDGKASDIDEAQAMQVMQAFAERMQAAQLAQMQEQQKKNAAEGEAFLAENAKKEGVQTTASGLQYEVLEAGNGPRPSANLRQLLRPRRAGPVRPCPGGARLAGRAAADAGGQQVPAVGAGGAGLRRDGHARWPHRAECNVGVRGRAAGDRGRSAITPP
jgi:hypothetical protein